MKKIIFIMAGLLLLSSCGDSSESNIKEETLSTQSSISPTEENIPEQTPMTQTPASPTEESNEDDNKQEYKAETFYQTESKIRSAVLAEEGVLYFGNENGEFFAVDIESKQELWQYSPKECVQTYPVFFDGKVLFNAGNSLYILNATTGEEIHKVDPVASLTSRVSSIDYAYHDSYVAVSDGIAYYATLDGNIVAVDISSAEILWTLISESPGVVASGVNIWNGKLYYVDYGNNLCCVDIQTGEVLFKTMVDDRIYAPMYIDDGMIYVAGRNCKISCINGDSGEILWSSFSYDKTTWFAGGSVSVGDTLFTGTSDEHMLVSYDKNTGELLRSYPTKLNVYTQPLVFGQNVIVAATDVYYFNKSVITEFDTQNHAELWQISIEDCVLSTPTIYEGVLYFGSDSGTIYSIQLK